MKFCLEAGVKIFLQMAVAVKKILYAADAKQSPLEEAQLYMQQTKNLGEGDTDDKAWELIRLREEHLDLKGICLLAVGSNGRALACGGS